MCGERSMHIYKYEKEKNDNLYLISFKRVKYLSNSHIIKSKTLIKIRILSVNLKIFYKPK